MLVTRIDAQVGHLLARQAVARQHAFDRECHDALGMRTFENLPVSLADIGQLLWAAQGITGAEGLRAARDAGQEVVVEL